MSTVKVAINGFGRIGRLVFRQIYNMQGIDVVAINDLTSPAVLAHLLKYDSVQGRFGQQVSSTENAIVVDGHFKTEFDTVDAAEASGRKLKAAYPMLQIEIYDAVKKTRALLS